MAAVRARIVVALLVVGAVAYLGGRERVVERIRIRHRPAPEEQAERTALERVLQERALAMHRREEWRRVLDAPSPEARESVRRELRRRVRSVLRPSPVTRPATEPRVVPWYEDAEVKVLRVVAEVLPGVEFESALLVPQMETPARRPAFLVLHGFDGDLRRMLEDVDYHHGVAMQLARAGFVVLAPHFEQLDESSYLRLAFEASVSGWSMQAVDLRHAAAALDVLARRPEVDVERIGAYGISWGGRLVLLLAALDQRVDLSVVNGHFTDRYEWLFHNPLPEPFPDIYSNLIHDMDLLVDDLNLVALIAPRRLAIESGTNDVRHTSAAREFGHVEELYEALGHPDRAGFFGFEGGHETAVAASMGFIEEWAWR